MEKTLLVVILCICVSLDARILQAKEINKTQIRSDVIKNLTKQIAELSFELKVLRQNVSVTENNFQDEVQKQNEEIKEVNKDSNKNVESLNKGTKKLNSGIDDLEKGDVGIKKNIKQLESEFPKLLIETKKLTPLVFKEHKAISSLKSSFKGLSKNMNVVMNQMNLTVKQTNDIEGKMDASADLVSSLKKLLKNETKDISKRISTLASVLQNLINKKSIDIHASFLSALEKFNPYGLKYAGRGYPNHFSSKVHKYVKSLDECYNMCFALRQKYGSSWDSLSYKHSDRYCACKKDSYGFVEDERYLYLRFPPYMYK